MISGIFHMKFSRIFLSSDFNRKHSLRTFKSPDTPFILKKFFETYSKFNRSSPKSRKIPGHVSKSEKLNPTNGDSEIFYEKNPLRISRMSIL